MENRFRSALLKIIKEEGKVCDNFMECDHRACNSSYAAWAIADEAIPKCPECGDRDYLGMDPKGICAECLWEDHLDYLAGAR